MFPSNPLTPEEEEALEARQAYKYAFMSAPELFVSWSTLAILLTNGMARALYIIPIAGYFILYSDYFQTLFQFSTLTPTKGMLTFSQRINLLYFGGIVLLIAYLSYLVFSPRLLRNKTNAHQFVSEILTSHDYSAAQHALEESIAYLKTVKIDTLKPNKANRLGRLLESMEGETQHIHFVQDAMNTIPDTLRFYFHWQDESRDGLRSVTGMLTLAGYGLLIFPAVDLFVRVSQVVLMRY